VDLEGPVARKTVGARGLRAGIHRCVAFVVADVFFHEDKWYSLIMENDSFAQVLRNKTEDCITQ